MEQWRLVRFPYFVGFAWLPRWWGFCVWRRNLWVLDDENGSGLDGFFFALYFTPEMVVASATVSGVLKNGWFMVVWVLDLLI